MSHLVQKLLAPTPLLYIYLVVASFARGIYLAGQIEPPAFFTFIVSAGYLWIVGWWLMTDSRKRGVAWVYDIGLFLYLAWPLILPYYLLKTRGARGLLVILAFAGTFVLATLVGMAFYLLLALATGRISIG